MSSSVGIENKGLQPIPGHLDGIPLEPRYAYVPDSKLPQSISLSNGVDLIYDYTGPIVQKVSFAGEINASLSYDYASDGNITRMQLSDASGEHSSFDYAYDLDGILRQVGDLTLTYNDFYRLAESQIGELNTKADFDGIGALSEETLSFKEELVHQVTIERDALGRVLAYQQLSPQTFGESGISYTYDVQGRLTHAKRGAHVVRQYTYDSNGNRIGFEAGNDTIGATYDGQDRLIRYGHIGYEYGADGRLAKKVASYSDKPKNRS